MLFKDLYKIAEGAAKPFVSFEALRKAVNAMHPGIGRVDVIAVEYPKPNNQAFYRLAGSDRSSAYDEEFTVAEIIYCDHLDHHPSERRYALTKELMHVFDTDEQRADSREKFVALMREIQNRPMPQHESAMFKSEVDTRWMAVLVLCPKSFRDQYLEAYRKGQIAAFDIAEIFRIPEWVVPFAMDEYYDVAHATLLA